MSCKNQNHTVVQKTRQIDEQLSEVHSCAFCETKFTKMDDLKLHNQLHDKNKDFICLLCKEAFSELQQLKLHDLRHSMEEAHEDLANIEQLIVPFGFISCHICNATFSCDEELFHHYIIHPDEVNVVKAEKEEEIVEDTSSVSYESSSEDELQVNYPILRQEIISSEKGKLHIRFSFIDKQKIYVEEITQTTQSRVKNKNKQLETPIKAMSRNNTKVFKSKSQNGVSNTKSITSYDLENKFPDENNEITCENDKGSIKLPRRSKINALKQKIWKHNPNIRPAKTSNVCTVCNKPFSCNSKLQRHLNVHRKASELNCHKCHRQFQNQHLLKKHYILHHKSNTKYYVCHVCNKRFSMQIDLAMHRKMHNRRTSLKKEFVCLECGKTFLNVNNLNNHNCLTQPEFMCKICHKVMSHECSLKRHLRNIHGIKNTEIFLNKASTYQETQSEEKDSDKLFSLKSSKTKSQCIKNLEENQVSNGNYASVKNIPISKMNNKKMDISIAEINHTNNSSQKSTDSVQSIPKKISLVSDRESSKCTKNVFFAKKSSPYDIKRIDNKSKHAIKINYTNTTSKQTQKPLQINTPVLKSLSVTKKALLLSSTKRKLRKSTKSDSVGHKLNTISKSKTRIKKSLVGKECKSSQLKKMSLKKNSMSNIVKMKDKQMLVKKGKSLVKKYYQSHLLNKSKKNSSFVIAKKNKKPSAVKQSKNSMLNNSCSTQKKSSSKTSNSDKKSVAAKNIKNLLNNSSSSKAKIMAKF